MKACLRFFVLSYVGRGLEMDLFKVQEFVPYVSKQASETWKTERPGPHRPVSAGERHRNSNCGCYLSYRV